MDDCFTFDIEVRDTGSAARVGRLRTPHGDVETPVFMPVGTQGSVKALAQEDLEALGVEMVLANAYHLYLRPGTDVLEQAGGLHAFMNWKRPILTDSGGFQVFSLGREQRRKAAPHPDSQEEQPGKAALRVKVTPEGVAFQSHIDGSRHFFTPEKAIDVQVSIGGDIIMCFDECTRYPVDRATAAESMRTTLDWAGRCKRRWLEREVERQALFGIVQGSSYQDLRRESAEQTVEIGFPGYAIGGVSVGESRPEMLAVLDWVSPLLPADKPRYLMGVGPPEDFLDAVERGIDMFDCVMPTRNARNGCLFTAEGRINLRNHRFMADFGPADPACVCPVCRRYTRAYLSHLYRSGEVSVLRLNTLHNLHFMLHLAVQVRQAVRAGRFAEFKRSFLHRYNR